jgi:selenocysteine lyase/cysteine desulfurase
MTISEILSDETLRQREFPVTRAKIFLAHAGVSPLPARVAGAIAAYAQQSTLGDQETLVPAFRMDKTRELAAGLLHAKPNEIAFVGPTSLALSFVASGLQFKKHNNVVVYYDDYPSNVYPWMALFHKGVEVRFLNIRELGKIRPADVIGQVDEQTRLVALASNHFVTGYRLDLNAIGAALHDRGILFCVDGIQTLGAFPTTVENIDFLAADSHKWMLGPCGAGILYVRESLQESLRPQVHGWNNVKCPDFIAQPELAYEAGARRYEAGSTNLLGLVGLHAALELIEEIGVDNIAAELLRKREWLIPAILETGFKVLNTNIPPSARSAIIALYHTDQDMAVVHHKLEEAHIMTSLRSIRSGHKYVRLSPHYYNTDEELHRLVAVLKGFSAQPATT